MSDKLIKENIPEIIKKYQKLKTLGKTAEYFGTGLETLRKFFILHNISYQKRSDNTINCNFFAQDNQKSFYWAGYLAGNSSIDSKTNRLKVEVKEIDKNHLDKLKKDLEATNPIYRRPSGKYFSYNIRIKNNEIIKDLLRFNINFNKNKAYIIPNDILNHQLFNHFLRGYFDGMGRLYSENNHSYIIFTGTIINMNNIFDLFKNKLNVEYAQIKTTLSNFSSITSGVMSDNKKIINYLYQNASIFLDKKKSICDNILLLKTFDKKLKEKDKIKRKIFNKLKRMISSNVWGTLKSNNGSKQGKSSSKYLGYPIEQLKNHLEKLFTDPNYPHNKDNNGNFWMTWNNRGAYKKDLWDKNDSSTWVWNLDHIIPHSLFEYNTLEHPDFKKCWHLNNLRPYSGKQNVFDRDNRNIIFINDDMLKDWELNSQGNYYRENIDQDMSVEIINNYPAFQDKLNYLNILYSKINHPIKDIKINIDNFLIRIERLKYFIL